MMQGAALVSSQYRPELFTPEPQHDDLPPGLLEHSEPPHVPQLVEQHTLLLALIPGISPPAVGQVGPARSNMRDMCRVPKGDGRSQRRGQTPFI